MGEVYRARDPELLRDVAVKILPEVFTSNPVRLARFTQEARTASSLNHPNSLTGHDVGRDEGVHFMVTELVEGVTLRRLLRAEVRLSARRALDLGVQIAEGLAKAHAAGVVHRDLKPENLMVTPDGLVKILDFGLAKLHSPTSGEAPASEISDLPTWPGGQRANRSTSDGSLVGTVGYVSPEQVRGRPADHRSDQFALGATLYEMVTGRRAFRGESRGETLAAIVDGEPRPLADLSPEFPAPAAWVVERCLAKEPVERYASTCDLAQALRGLRDHLSELESGGPWSTAVARARRRFRSIQEHLRPGAGRVAAAVAACALLTMGLVRGDTTPRGRTPWPDPREAPVAAQGPGTTSRSVEEPLLEVLTFRWTQLGDARSAGTAEPTVVEGRVERRRDSVRITARFVGTPRPSEQGGSDRRDLLAAAAAMAELLGEPADEEEPGREPLELSPASGPDEGDPGA